MIGIGCGLLGAVFIGGSDCIARVTSQRTSNSILILCVMGLSTTVLSVWLLTQNNFPPWHLTAWVASAISGALNVAALYFLYIALARGPVAVASPAASSFTVILVLMNVVSGEPWSPSQLFATLVVLAGVAMLAQKSGDNDDAASYDAAWLRTTALFGLAAGIVVAVRMFLAQEATDALGAMHGLYLNRLFATLSCLVLIAVQLARSDQLVAPANRSTWLLIIAQAILESSALAAFLLGSSLGDRVSATVGFSAFAAATVIIARVFLGERVGWWRGIWIAIIGAGVIVAVVGRPV